MTNLNPETSEDDLHDCFADYGTVTSIHLNLDRRTGYVKGYALVEFAEEREAIEAVKGVDGQEIAERKVHVDFAIKKPPRAPGSSFCCTHTLHSVPFDDAPHHIHPIPAHLIQSNPIPFHTAPHSTRLSVHLACANRLSIFLFYVTNLCSTWSSGLKPGGCVLYVGLTDVEAEIDGEERTERSMDSLVFRG